MKVETWKDVVRAMVALGADAPPLEEIAQVFGIEVPEQRDTVTLGALLEVGEENKDVDLIWEVYHNPHSNNSIKVAALEALLEVAKENKDVDLMWEVYSKAPDDSPLKTAALKAMLEVGKENRDVELMRKAYRNAYGDSSSVEAPASEAINAWGRDMLRAAKENKDVDLMWEVYSKAPDDSPVKAAALRAIINIIPPPNKYNK